MARSPRFPQAARTVARQTIVYNPGSSSHPVDLTADAAGDLYIADSWPAERWWRFPPVAPISGCQIPIGSGWSQPDDAAVDAAGDVFVADQGLEEIVEVPAGCTTPACQIVAASGINTVAVALDPSGDLVVDDVTNGRVIEINRSQPPSFNFALTNSGSISSPQVVTLQNVGNQPLTGTLALSLLGTNFAANGSSTCGTGFTLIPGTSCSESFSFTPQTTGYLTGAAAFSDNTLNLSPLVVLQTVNLSGNGGINGQAVGVIVPNVVGLTQAQATAAITGAGLTMGTVSTGPSSIVPSGSVSASNPAAGTQVSPGSAVRLLVSNGQPPRRRPTLSCSRTTTSLPGTMPRASLCAEPATAASPPEPSIFPTARRARPRAFPMAPTLLMATVLGDAGKYGVALGRQRNVPRIPITGQQIGSDLPIPTVRSAGRCACIAPT
jgi:hypothetical protein